MVEEIMGIIDSTGGVLPEETVFCEHDEPELLIPNTVGRVVFGTKLFSAHYYNGEPITEFDLLRKEISQLQNSIDLLIKFLGAK
jgi:hypothetical protein